MSKQVAKAQDNVPAAAMDLDAWGAPQLDQDDFVIPKLLVMQNSSQLVSDGVAKLGEFRNSLTGDLLGSFDEPVEIVPVHMERNWLVTRNNKFVGMEPVTPENKNRKWTEMDGNDIIKYEFQYLFVVLVPSQDLAPYTVSFKSTSVRTGKILGTQMYSTNRMARKVPPAMVMNLKSRREQNDKGTFAVMDISVARESTGEEITKALDVYKAIVAGKASMDQAPEPQKQVNDQEIPY